MIFKKTDKDKKREKERKKERKKKIPAANSEDGTNTVEFDFILALTDLKADVEQESRPVDVEEYPGKIFGQLVVAFKLVPHRVQERAGRSHVSDGSPRASPATAFNEFSMRN